MKRKKNKLSKKDTILLAMNRDQPVLSSQKGYSAHFPLLCPITQVHVSVTGGLNAFSAAAMSCQASPYPPENINTYVSAWASYTT